MDIDELDRYTHTDHLFSLDGPGLEGIKAVDNKDFAEAFKGNFQDMFVSYLMGRDWKVVSY